MAYWSIPLARSIANGGFGQANMGSILRQLWKLHTGVGLSRSLALLAPHLHLEAEVARAEQREVEDTDGLEVMPGAATLLAKIPDSRWGVVTSGTNLLATVHLRHARLPIPSVLVSAEHVREGKPHPEPYLMCARLLAIPATECLVIEDAPAGIESAHAAGMKAVGLTSTFSADQLHADAVVCDLRQLQVQSHDGMLNILVNRNRDYGMIVSWE